jgi:Sec-independent protein translocase protein TatA
VYDPFGILPSVGEVIQIVERQDPKFLVVMFPLWLGWILLLFPVTLVMTGFVGTIQSIWKSVTDNHKTETKAEAAENSQEKLEEKLQTTLEKEQSEATPQEEHNDDNRNPFRNPLKGWDGLVRRKG